jgi:neutral ceramidase
MVTFYSWTAAFIQLSARQLTMSCHLAIVSWLLVAPRVNSAEVFRVGAATTDITPPAGFPMWGYAARHDAACTGVLDPLKARAVVLAVDSTKLALVSLDLGRAPVRSSTQAIRDRLKADGITDVMLVASHTHHGPVLELDTWPDPKTPYTRTLEDKLVEVIRAADHAAQPARWGIAATETTFNRNRQSKRPDVPVDRTLTVVRLESLDGKPIAHLVHFAAHSTMHPASMLKFSADWPGAMAALVEKEMGVPCLFLQGAAGDLSPNPPPGVRGPVAFGETVGKAAIEQIKSIKCDTQSKPDLSIRFESFTFPARLDVSSPLVHAALSRAFFPELVAFYEREYKEGVRPQMTVALLDGKLGLVGLSGEPFCGHSLSLRKRARLDHTLLCGYCNDYQQYFPTIEATAEGGYGTTPPINMAEIGAGEKMIDRALVTLYRMRGLLPE